MLLATCAVAHVRTPFSVAASASEILGSRTQGLRIQSPSVASVVVGIYY